MTAEIVNTETGELIARPTYTEVRDSIAVAREAGAKFFEQIVWQVERRAWEVLGYEDWDAMREAEYADMGVVVPRADRPEIVTRMRRVGLTQQEIADTVGVSEATVSRDLASASSDLPETIETSRGSRPTRYTKTPQEAAEAAPLPTFAEYVEEFVSATDALAQLEDVSDDDTDAEPCCDRPETPGLAAYVESDNTVQLASWRSRFMSAISSSGQLMLFDPADVAENADVGLVNELERLSLDLNNYVARVRARRPHRLTAIKGGAQ